MGRSPVRNVSTSPGQDEVKLVSPPSPESQQDRTFAEPRNIAVLGQQECQDSFLQSTS